MWSAMYPVSLGYLAEHWQNLGAGMYGLIQLRAAITRHFLDHELHKENEKCRAALDPLAHRGLEGRRSPIYHCEPRGHIAIGYTALAG